jgi:hypothetical protein
LRLAGCSTLEEANRFLRERYLAEFNRRFHPATGRGSAFIPRPTRDLHRVFSLQFERTVNRDNTISFLNRKLQIEPVRWRGTLAGCSVMAHQHLDGTLSLSYGPHCLGRYDAAGLTQHRGRLVQSWAGEGELPPCGHFNLLRTVKLVSGSVLIRRSDFFSIFHLNPLSRSFSPPTFSSARLPSPKSHCELGN